MKKQVFFSLCLTASAAVLVTGCASQQTSQQDADQEAIEFVREDEQEVCETVATEPVIAPTETTTPAEETPAAKPAEPAKEEPVKEAPAAERPVVKPVHPQPVEYTVTAGDSVSALAVRFNVRKADILALNPALRKNPNALYVGQKVKLPAGTDVTVKAKPRKATPAKASAKDGVTYTVKSGDVLGGIAIRHGVTVAAIKKANNLKNDVIWVGQKLVIPGAKKTATATPKKTEKKAEPKKTEPKKTTPAPTPKAEPVVEPVNEEPLPPPPEVETPALPDATDDVGLPPPPPPAEAETVTVETFDYVVGEGEDLLSVAFKWGVNPATIRALNNLDEAQSNAVAPGTTLRLPKTQD